MSAPKPSFDKLEFPLFPILVLCIAFVLLILSISPYYQRREPIITIPKLKSSPTPVKRFSLNDCPVNGWVDCMPIIAPQRKYLCEKPFLDWAKINCPNFQGAAL